MFVHYETLKSWSLSGRLSTRPSPAGAALFSHARGRLQRHSSITFLWPWELPFFFLCRSRYDSTVICSPGYLFYTNLWQDPYNMWCIGFGVRSQTPVGWSREYWRRGSATSKTLKNIPVILEIHTSVRRSSNYFVSSNDFTSTCMQLTGDWHRHCNAAGLSALRGCVLFT